MSEGATKVAIIRTGVANLASVLAGFARAGVETELVEDAATVAAATHVLLPGVGAFGAGMAALAERGLVEPLRARIAAGRPTMAICLGLQLLAEGSEETPGVAGLGVLPGVIGRYAATVKVPQLGWNKVTPDAGMHFVTPGYAYFANSYRLATAPEGWRVAWAEHGGPFCAALERGAVLACQFHPELSSAWGLGLLRRWLAGAPAEALTSGRAG